MIRNLGNRRISPSPFLLRVIALLSIIMLVCSCSQPKSAGTNLLSIVLDDVVAVLGLNPQPRDVGSIKKGYVALVHRDGSYEFVNTSGMAIQQITWNASGVFFADRKADYHIARNPKDSYKEASPKSEVQSQMLSLENNTVVGVYDRGFTVDAPNSLEVQWLTPQPQRIVSSQASPIQNVAQCPNGVFGVSLDSTTFGASDNYVLNSITPDMGVQKLAESNLSNKHFSVYYTFTGLPCIDNQMIMFASESSSGDFGDYNILTLLAWDTKTHELKHQRVLTSEGDELRFNNLDSVDLVCDRYSILTNGTLAAANRIDGILYVIDIRTGVLLHEIAPPQRLQSQNGQYEIRFTENYVYYILTTFGNADFPAKIFVYGKDNWTKLAEIELRGALGDMVSYKSELGLTGFAANPDMTWD